jgi:hypothetical protein
MRFLKGLLLFGLGLLLLSSCKKDEVEPDDNGTTTTTTTTGGTTTEDLRDKFPVRYTNPFASGRQFHVEDGVVPKYPNETVFISIKLAKEGTEDMKITISGAYSLIFTATNFKSVGDYVVFDIEQQFVETNAFSGSVTEKLEIVGYEYQEVSGVKYSGRINVATQLLNLSIRNVEEVTSNNVVLFEMFDFKGRVI